MTVRGIDDLVMACADGSHIDTFRTTWVPYFLVKSSFDSAWTYQLFPWERIVVLPCYETHVAIDDGGGVEGIIAFGIGPLAVTGELVISFLATAPWNYGEGRLRRQVGTGLVGFAIEKSKTAGNGGALTLSSTRDSETFYERLQFDRTGQHDREGLAIFKLAPQKAEAFLKKNTPLR